MADDARGFRPFRLPRRTPRQIAREVDDELAFHLARRTEELISSGLSPRDARREAEARFGDLDYTRRYCRDEDLRREQESRRATMLDELRQDLRYGLRALRSAPGFALVALATLALGIGANTAIFSVVRGVLLRPLPFPDAERVTQLWHVNRDANIDRSLVSEPDFLEWKAATTRFTNLGGYWYQAGGSGANLTGIGNPERIEGAYVTPGFFDVLGTPALLGRTIRDEEAVVGNDRFVVLSHRFWERRLAGDPAIVGGSLTIDDVPYTVLGVMPPQFTFPADRVDYWMPLSTMGPDLIGRHRSSRFLSVVGRLAPGVTPAQAHDELAAIARRIAEREPEARGFTDVALMPVREVLLGEVRRPLLVLLGAVGFVLLITAVNIAGLFLARASARQSELALRSALGAGRARIVRQLLTESVVLALAGGVLGVALARVAVRAFAAAGAAELPRATFIQIDWMVLLYAVGIATGTGLLIGALPAWRDTADGLRGLLRTGARAMGRPGQGVRSALVVAEVALALVLVIGAGLATRSFTRLLDVDPGFDPEQVLAVTLNLAPGGPYQPERFAAYYETILERLAAVPGVEAVGAAKQFPFRGTGEELAHVIVPGTEGRDDSPELRLPLLHVSSGYFRAMGIPLMSGRDFTSADRAGTPLVVVVNEAFARRWWPDGEAVGTSVRIRDREVPVVGLVGNVRQASLTERPVPTVYIHYLQNMRAQLSIALRTTGDPLRYANAVRQAIWSVAPHQTITSVEAMTDVVGRTLTPPACSPCCWRCSV
ncbi:MAG TPA: ABC transporter permease [Gemmatimonadaceae bacterium]